MLLASIADEMLREDNPAAAYAHLRRAIQFAPTELQSSLEMLLTTWTTRISEYFPWMGPLELLDVQVAEQHKESIQKAGRLSDMGCWEPSAIIYQRILKDDPNNAALWHNCGLFLLWNHQKAKAAECLHRAASLLEGFDSAVETESLATLLEMELSDERVNELTSSRRVPRPRDVYDRLSASDRFEGQSDHETPHSTETSRSHFRILADCPAEADGGQPELGMATITANAEGGPELHFVSVNAQEDQIDEAWAIVLKVLGDAIPEDAEVSPTSVVSFVPTMFNEFRMGVHFGSDISPRKLRNLLLQRTTTAIEHWLDMPLKQLDGETLKHAATKPEMQLRVSALVNTLYMVTQRLSVDVEPAAVREQLGLPAPAVKTVASQQPFEAVPLLQYFRLAVSELSDDHLQQLAFRVGLFRSVHLMEKVVDELLRRPDALEQFSPQRAHLMKALVARMQDRVDDMAEAFAAARTTVENEADSFNSLLELDLKELSYRLDDPQDPGIPHLLRSMKEQYFHKVPEIESAVREELVRQGCEDLIPELDAPVIVTAAEETAAPSSGKLWLPGQD